MGELGEMDRYLGWVEKCGGMIRKDLLEVHEFTDGTGRGLRAKQDIKVGQVLVEVPENGLVSAENIIKTLGSKQLRNTLKIARQQGKLDDSQVMAVFLMWARCEENHKHLDQSFLNYLSVLPKVEQGPSALNQLIFWTEEELVLLDGTDSGNVATQLKQQMREDFGKIVSTLFLPNPSLFPMVEGQSKFTYHEFKWAMAIIWSRAMDFGVSKVSNQSSFRAIVPFADMFNSDFKGPLAHRRVLAQKVVQVLAKENYAAGSQVFINYSPTTNTRLAMLYGFTLRPPMNAEHEAVQLWAVMNPGSPYYETGRAEIEKLFPGFDPNREPFLLTEKDPLPIPLIVVLHCQRGHPAPVGNTALSRKVLQELEKALLARKTKYFNQGDRMKDLQLALKSSELKERERMALYIRMSENKILDKTLATLKNFITSLPEETDSDVKEAEEIDVSALEGMD